MAAHGEEELVLGRGDAGVRRPFLGPTEVAPQSGSEGEEVLVVLIGEGDWHENIVTR